MRKLVKWVQSSIIRHRVQVGQTGLPRWRWYGDHIVVVCPEEHHMVIDRNHHLIFKNGDVYPSIVCPECILYEGYLKAWHVFVTLVGFEWKEARRERTRNAARR